MIYRALFVGVLQHLDPERAHGLASWAIRSAHRTGLGRLISRATRPDPALRVEAFGVQFATPFGIAAGLDKDATMFAGLGDLGFGHVEVGTITAQAQPGNPRPRLFRLVRDRALINRMGFNNHGAQAALAQLTRRDRAASVRVGVNIGKNKVVPLDEAVDNYRASARVLAPAADYLAVNVSSPNTPGLRDLQHVEALRPILEAVVHEAQGTPVLVKLAPDMHDDELLAVQALAVELGLAGIIVTNTTIQRTGISIDGAEIERIGAGGLSGPPVRERSLEVLRLLVAADAGLPIISVGGVQDGDDVWERLRAGATLVQGFTEFIYAGPAWGHQINRRVAQLLASSEFSSIAEVTQSARSPRS